MGQKVQRKCPVCGASYQADLTRLRYGRETTCSRTCSYRFRGNKKVRSVTLVCSTCKIQFTRSRSAVKSKHGAVYCSRACHYAGRALGLTKRVITTPYVRVVPFNPEWAKKTVATRRARNNYGHSDETLARLREATTRRIAEGRVPAVSGLEYEVAEELARLGVGFQRQVAIRGARGRYIACVDFLLDDGRVLEVNGTFWHADPRIYPNGPVFPAQLRTAERWNSKINALADLGITLIVVWEQDLRESLSEALRVALS